MNLIELNNKFPTETEAIKHFELIRWGKKAKCAYCGSTDVSGFDSQQRRKCYHCKKTFSVTVGTQLQRTRIPLKTWMTAFTIVSNARKGVSSVQLGKDIGIQQRTAWVMYHEIRDLMSIENNQINLLEDIVETDTKQVRENTRKCEELAKGKQRGIPEFDEEIRKYNEKGFKFKKGEYKKPCRTEKQKTGEAASEKKIMGAVQRDGNVIAHVIKTTGFHNLRKLIDKSVKKGATKTVLLTDEAVSMQKFKGIMNSIAINHFKMFSYKGLNTNTIESFWAIIERQIVGQHHHVDLKYLEKYVAETVFKFNNRKDDDMFETLVYNAMQPLKYRKNGKSH